MLRKESRVLDRVSLNRRQRFRSIGHARCVAKINEALVRQMFMQRAIDCESTNAAVEDADGKIAVQDVRVLIQSTDPRYHIIGRVSQPQAVATGATLRSI